MKIKVEVKNNILGDHVFWEGDSKDIADIRNIPARQLAEKVREDGKTRKTGMWIVSVILIFTFFTTGCMSYVKVETDVPTDVSDTFHNFSKEKSFCLRTDGSCYNILTGGFKGVIPPICKPGDIMVHTHPFGTAQSTMDEALWDKYQEIYNVDTFGIVFQGGTKFYRHKEVK